MRERGREGALATCDFARTAAAAAAAAAVAVASALDPLSRHLLRSFASWRRENDATSPSHG
jgi:hypothetical protein